MTVFLTVLKVLGIILLVILGILLSLIIIILFVPLRYRIKGVVRTDEDHYDIKFDITWFLHIFHGLAYYLRNTGEDSGFGYEIRVFGIKVRPKKESADAMEIPEYEAPQGYAGPPDHGEPSTGVEASGYGEPSGYVEPEGSVADTEDDDIPKGFGAKIKDFTEMLRGLFNKVKGAGKNAGCKSKAFCDKIEGLRALLEDESTETAVRLAIHELMRILKALKPRRYGIDLIYGFEDPALTGEITGLLAVVFLSAGKRVSLRPDFDRQIIDGEFYFKGRLRIITIVIVLWKLYFNKDFRKFFKEIRG